MKLFYPSDSFKFSFQIDHVPTDRVTIDFRNPGQENICFHLSLRPEDNRLVVNSTNDGEWGEERSFDLPVDAFPAEIALVSSARTISITLDGAKIGSVARSDYPWGLALLTDLHPRISPDTVSIRHATPGSLVRRRRHIEFGPFQYQLFPGNAATELELSTTNGIKLNAFPTSSLDGKASFELHVPGSIWAGVTDDHVDVTSNGSDKVAFQITRADALRMVEDIARAPNAVLEPLQALTAMEHVIHAGLKDRLSPEASDFLNKVANIYNFDGYPLDLVAEFPNAATSSFAAQDSEARYALLTEFGRQIRNGTVEEPETLLRSLIDAQEFEPEEIDRIVANLTGYFCEVDRMEQLSEIRHSYGSEDFFASNNNAWIRSVLLPHALIDREYDVLASLLGQLPRIDDPWISASALGWAIVRLITEPPYDLPNQLFEQAATQYARFIEAKSVAEHALNYNAAIVECSARIVSNMRYLNYSKKLLLTTAAIKSHGLSPLFWETVRTEDISADDLAHRLDTAREHFETLRTAFHRHDAKIEGAVTYFKSEGTVDIDRFSHEMTANAMALGKFEVDVHTSNTRLPLADDRLRYAFFPRQQHDRTFLDTTRLARDIRLKWGSQPSRYYELRSELSEACVQVLASGKATSDDIADISRLAFATSEKSSEFGLLNLISAASALGGTEVSDRICETIGLMLKGRDLSVLEEQQPLLHSAQRQLASALHETRSPVLETVSSLLRNAGCQAFADKVRTDNIVLSPDNPTARFFDTLVVVYSCRKNLDGQVDLIRQTWLQDLTALGIPHVIVVGGGDGSLEGDILRLKVGDGYEDLPAKTLALFKWVARHTNFSHVLKIDDDCYLDVREFFFSQSYRLKDYFGRRISRQVGAKPRAWHMDRSSSPRGSKEFDKSPEPSSFADGGSGYILSRHAIGELLAAADSPDGRRLREVSYSEDKLVGDLLELKQIRPSTNEHYANVYRRPEKGLRPVLQWEVGPDPSSASPTKIVHTDDANAFADLHKRRSEVHFTPPRLWPADAPAKFGGNSNSLILLSEQSKLDQVTSEATCVISVVRNELFILPRFLEHYRKLGVRSFLIVDNISTDGTTEYLLQQPDVAVFSADTSFRLARQGTDWKIALLSTFCMDRWALVADADEFLIYDGWEDMSLADFCAAPENSEIDAFETLMIDMYPKADLSSVNFKSPTPFDEAPFVDHDPLLAASLSKGMFSNSGTYTSALRHRLFPGSRPEMFVSQKVPLVRYAPWMRFSISMHYAAEVRKSPSKLLFAHFKYNEAFEKKAMREIKRGQYFNNAEEYRRYIEISDRGQNIMFNDDISTPFAEYAGRYFSKS